MYSLHTLFQITTVIIKSIVMYNISIYDGEGNIFKLSPLSLIIPKTL